MSDDDTWQKEFGVLPEEGVPPSMAVVTAVAEAEEGDPRELPSLYDVVDPEALDALFSGHEPDSVEFRYSGYRVTVVDGQVIVQKRESE